MYIRQDRGYLHELEKKHVYTFFFFFLSFLDESRHFRNEKTHQYCFEILGIKVSYNILQFYCLKVVSATFLLVCFLRLKENTFETRKNVAYFTSKAFFVLEIIKF